MGPTEAPAKIARIIHEQVMISCLQDVVDGGGDNDCDDDCG